MLTQSLGNENMGEFLFYISTSSRLLEWSHTAYISNKAAYQNTRIRTLKETGKAYFTVIPPQLPRDPHFSAFLPAVDTPHLSWTTSQLHSRGTDPGITRRLLETVFLYFTSVPQFSLSMPYICDAEYIRKVCYPNTEDYSRNFKQNI